MYADTITASMDKAIKETQRRRKIQTKYNKDHNITPKGIVKSTDNAMSALSMEDIEDKKSAKIQKRNKKDFNKDIDEEIELLTKQMKLYAKNLEFELAAKIRDEIEQLKKLKTK